MLPSARSQIPLSAPYAVGINGTYEGLYIRLWMMPSRKGKSAGVRWRASFSLMAVCATATACDLSQSWLVRWMDMSS